MFLPKQIHTTARATGLASALVASGADEPSGARSPQTPGAGGCFTATRSRGAEV